MLDIASRFNWRAASAGLWLCLFATGSGVARAEPEVAPDSAEAARRALVLARFEGGQITLQDLEDAAAKKVPGERVKIAAEGGRQRFLDELIRFDLLAAEAARRGYAENPAVKDAGAGSAIGLLNAQVAPFDPAAVPADEVERSFAEHKREYVRPSLRRAAQVQLATRAEASALAAEVQGKGREAFAHAASEHSNDAHSKRQGGELGYFDADGNTDRGVSAGLPVPIVKAVFKLKRVGDVSAAIEHDGVYSVIMLTGEMPAVDKARTLIDAELRETLARHAHEKAVNALIEKLSADNPPQIHPELLDAIKLPPAPPRGIPEGFPAAPRDPRQPPRMLKPDQF
jgi:peptidyl-prolyl cis-trans isomerase C